MFICGFTKNYNEEGGLFLVSELHAACLPAAFTSTNSPFWLQSLFYKPALNLDFSVTFFMSFHKISSYDVADTNTVIQSTYSMFANINVIIYTCTFSALTSQNVCCEKGPLIRSEGLKQPCCWQKLDVCLLVSPRTSQV